MAREIANPRPDFVDTPVGGLRGRFRRIFGLIRWTGPSSHVVGSADPSAIELIP